MRYAFADCLLDTEGRELRRAGRPVRLRAKSMQVLTYLIEHAGRVVPKEELFARLWAGRIVGDATLNSCLKEVRRAVGDSGESQSIVRTLHGQGYRFVAPLAPAANEPAPAAAAQTAIARQSTPARSEHKQVTVLDCALADADAHAAALGAEAMDEAMHAFFSATRTIVYRYGGRISELRGDGFTALFGAPAALEDHARCAVLAALEIRAIATPPVRLAVHSGEVVVGSLPDREQPYTALGRTTQLAARMRDAAPTGVVAASDACHRLVETEVVAKLLGNAVAGMPAVWSIERFAVHRAGVPQRARSTFVGRAQELAIIRTRLDLAATGAGQVVCISGDPGIGKSRVLAEVRDELARAHARLFEAGCLPYRQATPYFTLARLLRGVCGIAANAPADAASRALVAGALRAGIDAPEDQRLLLELLDVGAGSHSEFEPGSSCSRVFALANRLLLQAGREQCAVIVIEDLHWMDATSGVWLAGFIQQLPGAALLVLVTCRPSYNADWLARSAVTRLALPRLSDADSTALVASMIGARAAPDSLRRRIVNQAQGNPFFLEELTWKLLDDDADEASVPTTIQAVLAARIDQLAPPDKALLQIAAVIDTPVPHALLRDASGAAPDDIDASLRRLAAAELLYPVESAGGLEHHFKHALTQNVAYGSLLSATRRELHQRIAELYEERFTAVAANQPELVAHHYTDAGVSRKALEYWRLAGQRATHRSANQEAVLHFERALEMAAALPDEAEQRRVKLDLRLRMGPPLMASRSFSSRDVEAAYADACALAGTLGDKPGLFVAQWGLWLHVAHRGRVADAQKLSRELLALGEELGDADFELQAHHAMWTTHLWNGDLAESHAHARAGHALYDRARHHVQTHVYGGHDPGVCALGSAGITAWFLGAADEAMRLVTRGGDLAAALGHPYSRLVTRFDFMLVGWLRREVEVVRDAADEALAICTRLGVPDYLAVARIFLGWTRAMTGECDAGVALLEEGLRGCREIGAERNMGSHLLLLADACLAMRRTQQGLRAVEEAGELIARTGESRWSSELLRMRGELSLLDGAAPSAAEPLFAQALEIAHRQGARAFELRAATSLARIRARRRNEARALLEPIYRQFDEGLDTADLRTARTLLRRLGVNP